MPDPIVDLILADVLGRTAVTACQRCSLGPAKEPGFLPGGFLARLCPDCSNEWVAFASASPAATERNRLKASRAYLYSVATAGQTVPEHRWQELVDAEAANDRAFFAMAAEFVQPKGGA